MSGRQEDVENLTTIAAIVRERQKNRVKIYTNLSESLQDVNQDAFLHFSNRVAKLLEKNNIEVDTGVTMETFQKLMNLHTPRDSRIGLTNEGRMTIFLKMLREGSSQTDLAKQTGLSQPTVCRIVKEIVADLTSHASEFIKFPTTLREIRTAQHGFFNKRGNSGNLRRMPCFSVLDGKHWCCEHPPHSGSLNYNYKAFFSFNSLVLCDSESRIQYVQISQLGCNSDAQLFANGPLPSLLSKARDVAGFVQLPESDTWMPAFVIADNGFGLSKTVLQPYRRIHLTSENFKFNEVLSRSRVQIENLFGILTQKFKLFRHELNFDPVTSRALIVAAFVIHNIQVGPVNLLGDDLDDPPTEDPYATAECQRSALKHFLLYE